MKQDKQLHEYSQHLKDKEHPKFSSKSLPCTVSYLLDPNKRPYKYLVAILVNIIMSIVVFCMDLPAGIQATMVKVMKLNNTKYNLIFSAYSWPDVVMSILGTVLVNKYLGTRRGLCIFCCILLAGQTIMSVGAYTNSFQILLCGRILLGCSVGTLISLTSSITVVLFKGKEVVFVMSLARCMFRLSSSIALFTPQFIYDSLTDLIVSPYYRHGTTLMFGTLLCLCAVLLAVIVAYLEKRSAEIIGNIPSVKKNNSILSILTFSTFYWILTVIIAVFYAILLSFTANAPLFFMSKYGFSKKAAGIANSLSFVAIILILPFFAVVIERVGYNLMWALFAISFAIIANLIYVITIGISTFAPYLAAIVFSFSFTIFGSAMYPAPGFVVQEYQLTTAYGILQSLLSFFVAINSFTGVIIDQYGYLMFSIFCIIMYFIIGLLSTLLSIMEVVSEDDAKLNVPGKARMKS